MLVTGGAFSDDGALHPLETWDGDAVIKLFRELLLARLIERHAISEDLAQKLLPGAIRASSRNVGEAIPFEDKSRINPSLGRNFEAMDPMEWLARMADHIPDAGRHRTHFYGVYASRVRVSQRETEASDVEPTTKRHRSPSWARLISRVYQADPLVCKGCGGPLRIVAYITDEISIKRILDNLGLSPPEQEKPPPTREVVRVPLDDEGREIQAG